MKPFYYNEDASVKNINTGVSSDVEEQEAEMLDPKVQQEWIDKGRYFMKAIWNDERVAFESDQDFKKHQHPLVKAPM